MMNAEARWTDRAMKAVLLIRILVGWAFLFEGIQKFLLPDSLGVGRFVKIGIPWPQVMAPFVEVVEIVCSSLLGRSSYASGDGASSHRYRCRFIFNQNCHVRQERILGNAA
jgi:hypothetical protein